MSGDFCRSGAFEDLQAWRLAMDLVEVTYRHTQEWPREERYGLTSQIRRAVASIPSNIAEGKGRASDREFIKFLNSARGWVRSSNANQNCLPSQLSVCNRSKHTRKAGGRSRKIAQWSDSGNRNRGCSHRRLERVFSALWLEPRAQSPKPRACFTYPSHCGFW
jgi:four helix bundle protein